MNSFHRKIPKRKYSIITPKNLILKREINKPLMVLVKIHLINFIKHLNHQISMKDSQTFPSHMNQKLHNMINNLDLVILKSNFTSKKNKWNKIQDLIALQGKMRLDVKTINLPKSRADLQHLRMFFNKKRKRNNKNLYSIVLLMNFNSKMIA